MTLGLAAGPLAQSIAFLDDPSFGLGFALVDSPVLAAVMVLMASSRHRTTERRANLRAFDFSARRLALVRSVPFGHRRGGLRRAVRPRAGSARTPFESSGDGARAIPSPILDPAPNDPERVPWKRPGAAHGWTGSRLCSRARPTDVGSPAERLYSA